MDIKAYWKAYHAKNRDKINANRRKAYADRVKDAKSIIKRCEVFNAIEASESTKPSAGKCIINGGPYPVCLKHINK